MLEFINNYLGSFILFLIIFLIICNCNKIKTSKHNVSLFLFIFSFYVLLCEIFYNTNIKYLYLDLKNKQDESNVLLNDKQIHSNKIAENYLNILHYTDLYKKNPADKMPLFNRTLAKYEILTKSYDNYMYCYDIRSIADEETYIPRRCLLDRTRQTIVREIENDFNKITKLDEDLMLLKNTFFAEYSNYYLAKKHIDEVLTKNHNVYTFCRYAAFNELKNIKFQILYDNISSILHTTKKIDSNKELYNKYNEFREHIYSNYEKFLTGIKLDKFDNYDIAIFYCEFARLKTYLYDLQGAKEEYKKALNYLNLVDMNKIRESLSETEVTVLEMEINEFKQSLISRIKPIPKMDNNILRK